MRTTKKGYKAKIWADGLPVDEIRADTFNELARKIVKRRREKYG